MSKKSKKGVSRKPTAKANGGGKGGKGGSKKGEAANASSNGGKPWMISSAAVALAAAVAAGYMRSGATDKIANSNKIEGVAGNEGIVQDKPAAIDEKNNRSLELDDVPAPAPAPVAKVAKDDSPAVKKASSSFSTTTTPFGPVSESSIAAFHSIASPASAQRDELMKYLMYDDGYSACLSEEAVEGAGGGSIGAGDPFGVRNLKKAKWRLINEWSSEKDRWVAAVPPRGDKSSAEYVDSIEESSRGIEGTCRLITLNHDDFGGRASEYLWDVLGNGTAHEFTLEDKSQGTASDFRTMACLSRFTEGANSVSPARNREEKYVRDVLLNKWAARAGQLKERADEELMGETEIPMGWSEHRDASGYSFYMNPNTQKTTWIRPVVLKTSVKWGKGENKGTVVVGAGNAGKKHTPPGPHEESGKVRHSALTVRGQPCKINEGMMKFVVDDKGWEEEEEVHDDDEEEAEEAAAEKSKE